MLGRVPGRTAAAFKRGDSTTTAVDRGGTSKKECRRGVAATEESVMAGGRLSSDGEATSLSRDAHAGYQSKMRSSSDRDNAVTKLGQVLPAPLLSIHDREHP